MQMAEGQAPGVLRRVVLTMRRLPLSNVERKGVMNMNGIWSAGWLSLVCVSLLVVLFEVEPALGQATLDPNPPAPWIKFVTGRLASAVLIVVAGVCCWGVVRIWMTPMTALITLGGAMLVRIRASYFLAGEIALGTLFFAFGDAVLIVRLLDPVARMRRWEQRLFWGV